LTALAGAEIILIPTAIGWHPAEKTAEGAAQHDAWQTIQRSHAIANGCFVAAVNRIGHEAPAGGEGIEFWGQSFVAAPNGRVIAQAATDQPETLLVQANLAQVYEARTHWPFLRDRRIDAYGGITERFLD
ncbi:MAG: nitrilase-related carbon-nitrogen hydrolase, partial [Verrucomicrobiia bacterium]